MRSTMNGWSLMSVVSGGVTGLELNIRKCSIFSSRVFYLWSFSFCQIPAPAKLWLHLCVLFSDGKFAWESTSWLNTPLTTLELIKQRESCSVIDHSPADHRRRIRNGEHCFPELNGVTSSIEKLFHTKSASVWLKINAESRAYQINTGRGGELLSSIISISGRRRKGKMLCDATQPKETFQSIRPTSFYFSALDIFKRMKPDCRQAGSYL